ncbi:MFS transporter [Candidatus Woesearchaeota archaeon]|nr:MFS transporter [Candidatus Woesearchaeota archaeon]
MNKKSKIVYNGSLRILLITNGLVLIAGAMLAPIYALFVDKVGGSLLDASLTGGIFALAAGITTLIAGRYADKIKNSELIVVAGYLMMGLGFFLYIFVNSVIFLFLVQVLIGFSEAFYSPAFDALYSKHLDKHKEGREWGAWEAINYFAIAGGAALGGLVVTLFGFSAIFAIMGALCLASALYIWQLPRKLL